MKLLLTFTLILILSYFNNNLSDVKIINKGIYISYYSEHYENPIKVVYKLYKPHHIESRKGMNFYSELGIHTADNNDYVNNVYDHGHLAPAEDFSDHDMNKTFSYINCAVQHSNLNQGVWEQLEAQERIYAQADSLLVTCDIILSKKSKQLPTGAYIPDKFRKTIVWLTTKKKTVYEFPNKVCPGKYSQYKIK